MGQSEVSSAWPSLFWDSSAMYRCRLVITHASVPYGAPAATHAFTYPPGLIFLLMRLLAPASHFLCLLLAR